VREYATDAALVRRADLAFVGTVAERRLVTRSRRTAGAGEDSSEAPGGSTADARSVMASIRMSTGGAAVAAPTGTRNDGEEKSSSSAVAVASIKEIIGDSHGAKRKCCAHHGCDKVVKFAGFCSAHGPSRLKCDHEEGCTKVAVQGGRCIKHGARRRKRVCSYQGGGSSGGGGVLACGKHAKVGGMCKKHNKIMVEGRGKVVVCGVVGGGKMKEDVVNVTMATKDDAAAGAHDRPSLAMRESLDRLAATTVYLAVAS